MFYMYLMLFLFLFFFRMGPKTQEKPKRPKRMITKDIGGDKNGGKRTVRVNRMVCI